MLLNPPVWLHNELHWPLIRAILNHLSTHYTAIKKAVVDIMRHFIY